MRIIVKIAYQLHWIKSMVWSCEGGQVKGEGTGASQQLQKDKVSEGVQN